MVMKASVKKYAGAIGLAGALVVVTATSAFAQSGPDFAQLRPDEGGGGGFPYQYCVPQDENSGLRQPLYC
jgi:hypothetical protein